MFFGNFLEITEATKLKLIGKAQNTNRVCHIMGHMLLHSYYKPANSKFESSHSSTNAIINKANHIA